MKKHYLLTGALTLLIVLSVTIYTTAQSSSGLFWKQIQAGSEFPKRTWYPDHYQLLSLQKEAMKNFLAAAPMENTGMNSSTLEIELPMPDGNFHRYSIVESPVMASELAAAYQYIKTYSGQGIDDRTATIRFDITPSGFHAYILSAGGTVYIDPVEPGNTEVYIVYYKHDISGRINPMNCLVQSKEEKSELNNQHNRLYQPTAAMSIGTQLRTYRLALAADYEYTTYHGGTITGALAAMVTTMNRVNGIYERELGIHMNLVANDTLLIFTASNDPYSNSNGNAMLGQNVTTCNNYIGVSNYDIGHVFSTDGGGIATFACVCASYKAEGVTGSFDPVGDPFDVDFVAHEMGHQFGADHSFNSTTGSCGSNNRAANSAYEPGSASTIMGYAGICLSNDLQPNSDAYFHTRNFDQIVSFSQTGNGNTCASITPTGNNAPVLTIPSATFTIPYQTPFKLTASATDPDGDSVTYCWEEYDLGPSGNWTAPRGNAPSFRSFNPTTSPTRMFPQLSSILLNNQSVGEVKPAYARSLSFRCTARDNRFGGGGVIHSPSTVTLNVDSTGIPFAITYPNVTGITWSAGASESVNWNVGLTDQSPINTPLVNIYLSLDNGQSFPVPLGLSIPNSGTYAFTVPAISTTQGRILVEGDGNVFFDINNRVFTILDPMGIHETNIAENINLYPNPFSSNLHCVINTPSSGKCRIILTDITGREVKDITFDKYHTTMDYTVELGGISNGMYIMRFELPEGIVQKKLVKE